MLCYVIAEMLLNLLRVFFVVVPLALASALMVNYQGCVEAWEKVQAVQGEDGWLRINSGREVTLGSELSEWLIQSWASEDTQGERVTWFRRIGRDLDVLIRQVEDMWLWIAVGGFAVLCGVVLLTAKNYSS